MARQLTTKEKLEPAFERAARFWTKTRRQFDAWNYQRRLRAKARSLGITLPRGEIRNSKAFVSLTLPDSRRFENAELSNSFLSELLTNATQRERKQKSEFNEAKKRGRYHALLKVRVPKFSSFYFYIRSRRIWSMFALSLIIDPVLLNIPMRQQATLMTSRTSEVLTVVCLFLCVIIGAQEQIFKALQQLRELQEKLLEWGKKNIWLLISLLGLTVIGEVSIRSMRIQNVGFTIALLLAGLAGSFSLYKEFKAQRAKLKEFTKDRILWVEHTNHQYFALALTPMILARAISALGAIQYLGMQDALVKALPNLAAGFILLLYFKPKETQFITVCKGCSAKTSRAIHHLGYCPRCAPGEFELKEEIRLPSTNTVS